MPERVAQGRGHLTHGDGIAVAEDNRGQRVRRRIDPQQSQIRIRVAAQHFPLQFGVIGEDYRYPVVAGHYMVIGNDMAGVIPHEAGAGGSGKESLGKRAGVGNIRSVRARRLIRLAEIPGNLDEHHRGQGFFVNAFDDLLVGRHYHSRIHNRRWRRFIPGRRRGWGGRSCGGILGPCSRDGYRFGPGRFEGGRGRQVGASGQQRAGGHRQGQQQSAAAQPAAPRIVQQSARQCRQVPHKCSSLPFPGRARHWPPGLYSSIDHKPAGCPAKRGNPAFHIILRYRQRRRICRQLKRPSGYAIVNRQIHHRRPWGGWKAGRNDPGPPTGHRKTHRLADLEPGGL